MEIIRVKNIEYSRYEELLLYREQLRKEAYIYRGLYMKQFGDLLLEIFEIQIECIKKKKMLAYYQMALNRGDTIEQEKVDEFIAREMQEYQKQLQDMIDENKAARKMKEIPSEKFLKIKKIYRRLAKQLHPDINPRTNENKELLELWNLVVVAYNCNSLEDIEEAEILVNQAFERIGMGAIEIEIPNISEKIEALEEDIQIIKETEPYQYKYILDNSDLVQKKTQELEEEKKTYLEYRGELDKVLAEIIKSGVRIIWKMN